MAVGCHGLGGSGHGLRESGFGWVRDFWLI